MGLVGVAVLALLVAACAPPQPLGPGMMGGPGPGMGYGMGPGMMGPGSAGYGMSPGMTGPGGCGMGPGMMGPGGGCGVGYGMGPGTMGGGPWGGGLDVPDLTDEQQQKIAAIVQDSRRANWDLMRAMHESVRAAQGQHGGFDEAAARRHFESMSALHKQMFERALETRRRIDELLTPAQRERLHGGR